MIFKYKIWIVMLGESRLSCSCLMFQMLKRGFVNDVATGTRESKWEKNRYKNIIPCKTPLIISCISDYLYLDI